jgi:hypothetical protein
MYSKMCRKQQCELSAASIDRVKGIDAIRSMLGGISASDNVSLLYFNILRRGNPKAENFLYWQRDVAAPEVRG